jgi:hypothetical protein
LEMNMHWTKVSSCHLQLNLRLSFENNFCI